MASKGEYEVPTATMVCEDAVPVEGPNGDAHAHFVFTQQKQREFDRIMMEYEVQPFFAQKMRAMMCGTKKVIVVDNSSSMNWGLSKSPLQAERPGQVIRRMDELQHFIRNALPILTLDSPDGVDVWFLNDDQGRAGPMLVQNVHTFDQIAPMLKKGYGCTPLIQTLAEVIKTYRPIVGEEGAHVLVTTDGAPNEGAEVGGRMLQNMLCARPSPSKFVFNFLVCSDRDSDVEYLNVVDKKCPNVDVVDDYESECKETLRKGRVKSFTPGDYVVKAIIGGADAEIDQQDETPGSSMYDRNRNQKTAHVPAPAPVPAPTHTAALPGPPQPVQKPGQCCIIL